MKAQMPLPLRMALLMNWTLAMGLIMWVSNTSYGQAPDGILVAVQPERVKTALSSLQQHGLIIERQVYDHPMIWHCRRAEHSADTKIDLDRLEQYPGIQYVSINRPAEPRLFIPNDELFDQQWNLSLIGADEAWDEGLGGQTKDGQQIVIANFDGGFRVDHPDLIDQVWINDGEIAGDGIDNDGNGYVDDHQGWTTGSDRFVEHQVQNHGTEVSGVMSAATNNEIGVAGVGNQARLMLVSSTRPVPFESDILESMMYVRQQRERYNASNGAEGALVVALNLSLGFPNVRPSEFPMFCEAINTMGEAGVLVTNATVNDGVDIGVTGDIPALCPSPYLIVVTSSRANDQRVSVAGYSQIHVDLAAPGANVLTTRLNGYGANSGTSLAAPHAAGALAVMYSVADGDLLTALTTDPSGTAGRMRSVLLETVTPVASMADEVGSGGRLNLGAAIDEVIRLSDIDQNAPGLQIWVTTDNATQGQQDVYLFSETTDPVTFELFDMSGRQMEQWRLDEVQIGRNFLGNFSTNLTAAGVYLLRATQNNATQITSFGIFGP